MYQVRILLFFYFINLIIHLFITLFKVDIFIVKNTNLNRLTKIKQNINDIYIKIKTAASHVSIGSIFSPNTKSINR